MTIRLIFCLIVSSQFAFGQKDVVHISGRVTDKDDPNLRIYGLFVNAIINDSVVYEKKCDSLGEYKLDISINFTDNSNIKISLRQDKNIMRNDFPKDKECPYSSYPNEYQTKDYRVITPTQSIKDYRADFSLEKFILDFRFPCLSFKTNRTKVKECGGSNADQSIEYIKCLLKRNPKMEIEVRGRSWNEHFEKRLSEKRASSIKSKLVASGIDKRRIRTIGVADRNFYYSQQTIFEEIDRPKKLDMIDANRSISIVIISFDYDPDIKKINADQDKDD